ncbi:MAG: stage II sporulation protein M [Candidatus Diapherotrites archaeon]|nr:stage II sporulation protein M [Candidatus Diapherotrites archaeon]
MVLESLIKPEDAERNPLELFFATLLFASVSLWLAGYMFPGSSSILMVSFVTIITVPLFLNLFRIEESKDRWVVWNHGKDPRADNSNLIYRHSDVMKTYAVFFIALVFAFSFWYTILPSEETNLFFKEQVNTWKGIKSAFSGNVIVVTESCADNNIVCACNKDSGGFAQCAGGIFKNNFLVLLLAVITSFLFGAGAVWLITWNASVLSVAVGELAKSQISLYSHFGSFAVVVAFVFAMPQAILLYMPHGMPEISAYFLAAVSGGIISAGIATARYRKDEFMEIIKDSLFLFIIAVLMLIVGALIEASSMLF